MKLGTRFVRVAAAGSPQGVAPVRATPGCRAARRLLRRMPVRASGARRRVLFLAESTLASSTTPTRPDSQIGTDASFSGSYQFGFQDSFYEQIPTAVGRMERRGPGPGPAGEVAIQSGRAPVLVPRSQQGVQPAAAVRGLCAHHRCRRPDFPGPSRRSPCTSK